MDFFASIPLFVGYLIYKSLFFAKFETFYLFFSKSLSALVPPPLLKVWKPWM